MATGRRPCKARKICSVTKSLASFEIVRRILDQATQIEFTFRIEQARRYFASPAWSSLRSTFFPLGTRGHSWWTSVGSEYTRRADRPHSGTAWLRETPDRLPSERTTRPGA
jgi:hypothetical protein